MTAPIVTNGFGVNPVLTAYMPQQQIAAQPQYTAAPVAGNQAISTQFVGGGQTAAPAAGTSAGSTQGGGMFSNFVDGMKNLLGIASQKEQNAENDLTSSTSANGQLDQKKMFDLQRASSDKDLLMRTLQAQADSRKQSIEAILQSWTR